MSITCGRTLLNALATIAAVKNIVSLVLLNNAASDSSPLVSKWMKTAVQCGTTETSAIVFFESRKMLWLTVMPRTNLYVE